MGNMVQLFFVINFIIFKILGKFLTFAKSILNYFGYKVSIKSSPPVMKIFKIINL